MEAGEPEADPGSHPTTKVRALAGASFSYIVVGGWYIWALLHPEACKGCPARP